MNKYLFILISALFLSACIQNKPQQAADSNTVDPKNLISCEGIGEVKLSYTYEDLKQLFGEEVLADHENTASGNYTSVWEGEPRRVNVYWKEATAPFKQIKYIEVNDSASPYMTETGLRVGISIKDVVKINGNMPLTFINFYAVQHNGVISSFNGGTIEKETPCLTGHLEIYGKRNIDVGELKRLRDEKTVESYDPILERMEVALGSIRVQNP